MDERDSRILLQESITDTIDKANQNPNPEYLSLYNVLLQNRSDIALRQQIAKIFYFCRAQVDQHEWLDNAANSHINPQQIINKYERILKAQKDKLRTQLDQFSTQSKKLSVNLLPYIDELHCCLDGQDVKLGVLNKKKCKVSDDDLIGLDLYNRFKQFKKDFKDLVEQLNMSTISPTLALPFVQELVKLAKQTLITYSQKKRNTSKLDFADIEHFLLKVLSNDIARTQLQASIKYMFVDEYQDINPLQDKILELLGEKSQVFIVGDVKQSIYGFRSCDPKFFVQKMQDEYLSQKKSQLINLNGNFRSNKTILDFVNCVFSPIMTREFGGSDYAKDSMLVKTNIQEQPLTSDTLAPVVCKVLVSEAKEKVENLPLYQIVEHVNQPDKNAAEINAIVQHINHLVINCKAKFEDIAILTRNRDAFAYKLCNSLNQVGYTAKLGQQISVFQDRVVASVLSYLTLIDDKKNDIAFATVLLSQFYNFLDTDLATIVLKYPDKFSFVDACIEYSKNLDDNISKGLKVVFDNINKYQNLKHALTVSQLAHTIVADHNFLMSIYGSYDGAQESLYWFLNDLCGHPYEHNLSRYIQCVYENPPNIELEDNYSNCIAITTVHASKGLEYEYLILANTDSRFNVDDLKQKFLLNSEFGIAAKYFDTIQGQTHTNSVYDYFKYELTQTSKSEQMRLLYVALTRAKKHLAIFMSRQANSIQDEQLEDDNKSINKWSQWLEPAINDNPQFVQKTYIHDQGELDINIIEKKSKFIFGKPQKDLVEKIQQVSQKNPQKSTLVFKSSVTRILKTEENEPIIFDDKNTQIGVKYHQALEYMDFGCDFDTAYQKLGNLAQDLQKTILEKAHKTLGGMVLGNRCFREQAFMLNSKNLEYNTALIQGVIDMIIINQNVATIVDYKYSVLPQRLAIYTKQLELYSQAISSCLGIKVDRCFVYDISLDALHLVIK
jgi:ATP-dependent helicase/nuclease subunit A